MAVIRQSLAFRVFVFLAATMFSAAAAMAPAHNPMGREDQAATDALFTNGVLHLLTIQIPTASLRTLNRDPRTYVKATVREGGMVITKVMIRLKGGAGSWDGYTFNVKNAIAGIRRRVEAPRVRLILASPPTWRCGLVV